MDSRVLALDGPVLCFPVRHHSPACARAVTELIERVRPAAVLIEGPHDFTPRIDELMLPHRLPIAIYSWVAAETESDGDSRYGAFYPFCIYSPEWQALQAGRRVGARLEFIDRPWTDMATKRLTEHRYAEPELRRSPYVAVLCERMGAPDLDALWDRLFEIEQLPLPELWERLHHFCYALRTGDEKVPHTDLSREAFMAGRIEAALQAGESPIVAVTGGFHSYALYARIHGLPYDHAEGESAEDTETGVNWKHSGSALTPYSYQRLDALRGYEAGMPNPGFYHRVWELRNQQDGSASKDTGRPGRSVLAEVARDLRKRRQIASSADLIAALGTGEALATLRGHNELWRRDLVDGVVGALVKDELAIDGSHPFLEAVHEALRGSARGRLADTAPVAPLAADLKARLQSLDLEFEDDDREIELDLLRLQDLEKSRLLHQIRVLGLTGFERTGGNDWVTRNDLSRIVEKWQLKWSTEAHASVIEASIFGPTVIDAAEARLLEKLAHADRDAEAAALLLLDASLMGRPQLAARGFSLLESLIRSESDLFRLARALRHLLYLFRFDTVLGSAGQSGVGVLLQEAWKRGVWLLESTGSGGRDSDIIGVIDIMVDIPERCGRDLDLGRESLVETLLRLAGGGAHAPLVRGAATGALWTMHAIDEDAADSALPGFSDPGRLGDFLTGLFALAREAVQRHPTLLSRIDNVIASFSPDEFLEALPALRLAFSYFTPREKHHMALTLVQGWNGDGTMEPAPLPDLEVSPATAAANMQAEARLQEMLRLYGLRPFRETQEAL